MPAASTADVSVIIPVGPGRNQLDPCLESLSRCRPRPTEVIVVVDGAGEATAEQARRLDADVVIQPTVQGPAAARNRGADRAGSKILLFIDSDVVVKPDIIGRVALLFAGDSAPSAVFGSYDAAPAAPGLVSKYRNLLHHWVHQHACEQASTFWTGCGAITRSAFEEVGGFPEEFREPSVEDIAFGARLHRLGHHIRLDPTLQVTHLKHWNLADLVTTDLFQRAVPWTELMVRDRRLVNDLNVGAKNRLSVGLLAMTLVATAISFVAPVACFAALAAGSALVAANLDFYRFLADHNGWWFAARSIPLHWLYFLVCGAGFAIGTAKALTTPARPATVRHEDRQAA